MGAKKYSDEIIWQLRTRYVLQNEYLSDLCAELGIPMSYAWRLVTGEDRPDAGGPLHTPKSIGPLPQRPHDQTGNKNPNAIGLTPEDRELVKQLVREGRSHQAAADFLRDKGWRISKSTVRRIVNA